MFNSYRSSSTKCGDIINSQYIQNVNIRASFELAKWSKKKNIHFIFISGSAIYKEASKKNYENSKILKYSKNIYLNTKIKSEKKIVKLLDDNKHRYTILRPSSIYGTGINKNKIISKYLKLLKSNKKLIIYDHKKTLVNFIHANDIACAIYLCFVKKKSGVFNLGSRTCADFLKLSKILKKITKSKSKIILVETKKSKKLDL